MLAGLDAVAVCAGGDEVAMVDGLGACASGGCDAVGMVRFGCGAGAATVLELAAVAGGVEAILACAAAGAC
ncbi:hypothetical protein [Mycolicibacterium brisbanense]